MSLIATAVADAADGQHPAFDKAFELSLGGQYVVADANVSAVVAPLPETGIDLDDMGIDDEATVFYAAARWRFAERWAATLTYNEFDQSGATEVSDTFNFDGVVYPAGARLNSQLQLNAYILDVAYSFGKASNYEWGAGLGLHALDLAAELDANLFIGQSEIVLSQAADSLLAPVPNVRVFADYAFNHRNILRFNAGWLSADYEDYSGSLIYASLRLEHAFNDSIGAGIGAQYTGLDLRNDPGGRSRQEYDAELLGVMGFLTYRF
ncbi:MAG: hypothetical protein V2J89_14695 [Halieaceae bacterium]|jgi:hypothetical protein|nr:hypothetical protein [Halieaceae bacterium]